MDTKQSSSLASKLAAIMADIDHVEKKGRNKEQGYAFVRSADVANMCRKKLAAEKIAVIANEVERVDGEFQTLKGTIMHTVRLKTEYTLIDGDSGEKLTFHGWGDAFDTSDKAVNKCKTASLKYALRNLFLIPDEADPEADASVDEPGNQKTADPAPILPSTAKTEPAWCENCGEEVVGVKHKGEFIPAARVLKAALDNFRRPVCAQCQVDIKKSGETPTPEPVSEPDGQTIMVAEVQDTTKGYLKVKYHAPGSMGELDASLWDKKLWPLFELPAGKKFVVKIESKTSKGRTYNNIVDVLKVGEYFVENGELVIQRLGITDEDVKAIA